MEPNKDLTKIEKQINFLWEMAYKKENLYKKITKESMFYDENIAKNYLKEKDLKEAIRDTKKKILKTYDNLVDKLENGKIKVDEDFIKSRNISTQEGKNILYEYDLYGLREKAQKEISEARYTLTNPEKKEEYNKLLEEKEQKKSAKKPEEKIEKQATEAKSIASTGEEALTVAINQLSKSTSAIPWMQQTSEVRQLNRGMNEFLKKMMLKC